MMSDSQTDPVQWWLKSPASTLSAEASPFVPKNFIPLSATGNSDAAGPCATSNAQEFCTMDLPGYYSSLVPTPALPFYAMQYQCMYPPQTNAFPNNEVPTLVAPSQTAVPRPNRGRRRKEGNVPRVTRSTSDKQPARDRKVQHAGSSVPTVRRDPDEMKSSQETAILVPKPVRKPDLTNNVEFPSLSTSSEPERPQSMAAKESLSYSTALKQQPQKVIRGDSNAPSETKSSETQMAPRDCTAPSTERQRTQRGQRGKKNANAMQENTKVIRNTRKVYSNGTSSQKTVEANVPEATSKHCSKQEPGSRACIEPRSRDNWRQSCDRTVEEPKQCIVPASGSNLHGNTVPVDVTAAVKSEVSSYAAALHRAPRTTRAAAQEQMTAGEARSDGNVGPRSALQAHKNERSKCSPVTSLLQSQTSRNAPRNLTQVKSVSVVEGRTSRSMEASKTTELASSSRANPQVRLNVSKVKKETHNSAHKRNVLKSSQQKSSRSGTQPNPSFSEGKRKTRKKKAPKVPDLMVDKVGVISQDLLDFLQGGGGNGGGATRDDSRQTGWAEDVLAEYPALEGTGGLPEQGNRSSAQFGTYSKAVASSVKATPPAASLPRSAQPLSVQKEADFSSKKGAGQEAEKKSLNTGLRKLVSLGNTPTPMHKEPISMQINSIILPKEKQLKKLKGKENLLSGSTKKEVQTAKGFANVLDSSAPLRKRGKERELPRKKKLSVMKRLILKEREQRKQLLGKMKQAATLRQQLIESSTALEEHIVEDKVTQNADRKFCLHTKNFREYCDHLLSKEINDATKKLISDLVLFQDRLHLKDPIKARTRRRLVYGLKEVRRYLTLNKLKCIIFAPDIEEVKAEGGLNDSLQDLIDTARKHSVPVVFAMKRRALGHYSKKCVPISCIGIFDYSGREADFKHLTELVEEARKAYSCALQQLESSENAMKAVSPCSSAASAMRSDAEESLTQQCTGNVRTVEQSATGDVVSSAAADDGWVTTNDTDEDSADEWDLGAAVEARAAKVSRLLVNVIRESHK